MTNKKPKYHRIFADDLRNAKKLLINGVLIADWRKMSELERDKARAAYSKKKSKKK